MWLAKLNAVGEPVADIGLKGSCQDTQEDVLDSEEARVKKRSRSEARESEEGGGALERAEGLAGKTHGKATHALETARGSHAGATPGKASDASATPGTAHSRHADPISPPSIVTAPTRVKRPFTVHDASLQGEAAAHASAPFPPATTTPLASPHYITPQFIRWLVRSKS